jgi:hypothetical protein
VALVEAFKQIFTDLSNYAKTCNEAQKNDLVTKIQTFLMEVSCDPTSEKYKYMAHYDSRIFNFDKPNKYKEEVKIIRAILENINLLPLRELFTLSALESFRNERQVKAAKDLEGEAIQSLEDPFKKSEFIFCQVLQRLFEKKLANKGGETKTEKCFESFL